MNRSGAHLLELSKALLKVGYRCNNRCLFCHSAPHRGFDADTDTLVQKIEMAHRCGVSMVVFSGGEPTVRRDLSALAEVIRTRSMVLGLVTNGRMLCYRSLRRTLRNAGLQYLQITLAGGNAAIHDPIVRVSGAFEQLSTGVRALVAQSAKHDLLLTLNCLLSRPLLETPQGLQGVVSFVLSLARHTAASVSAAGENRKSDQARLALRLKLSAVEPEGAALEHFTTVVPSLTATAAAVNRLLAQNADVLRAHNVAWGVEGLPPCLLEGPAKRLTDLRRDGFVLLSEAFEERLLPIDDLHMTRPPPCRRCSNHDCPGVYTTYVARQGFDELRPRREKRSNQALFRPHKRIERTAAHLCAKCPLETVGRARPRVRQELYVFADDDWTLYRTETRDCGPARLERLLYETEQVYLQKVPPSPAPRSAQEDFTHQLQKLERLAVCRTCRCASSCGGVYHPIKTDVFVRDRKLIDTLLARFHGRVLDVGCGSAPYLARTAHHAPWQYCGLDPDLHCCDGLHRTADGFFAAGAAEALPFAANTFDGVFSIRSLPHFIDLDAGVHEMVRVCRPQRPVLLITDLPSAVLQPKTGDLPTSNPDTPRAPPTFQHYHNPTPAELIATAERCGLHILETRAVSPDTSNLFVLFCQTRKSRV
jgi:SAM-dependent methyltransferase